MVNKVITSNSTIKTTAAQVEIHAEPNKSLTFIGSPFLRLFIANSENRQSRVGFEVSFGTDNFCSIPEVMSFSSPVSSHTPSPLK